ncbi:MAG: hypothetical protein HY332_24505 [Chloroflexi bacterium]|nr:hypothetical protein [Chloroflexota bacterium]
MAEVRPVGASAKAAHQGSKSRRAPTEADREAFLASFGSWKGLVDVDQLKRDPKASRQMSRPAPKL